MFDCAGDKLVGVLHFPANLSAEPRKPVVVNVVGGPQYRVGSHRQFVLTARHLAAHGYPVFRFDYRGMGDSEGDFRTFEFVAQDIECALDIVRDEFPSRAVVLMGLCDGASAILMYPRLGTSVAGVALLNPWVRSETTIARTFARHYYGKRVFSTDFWAKVLRLDWDFRSSVASLVGNLRRATVRVDSDDAASFVDRMKKGFSKLNVPTLIALSERDLTAREFEDLTINDRAWSALMRRPNVRLARIVGADHTLSSAASIEHFDSVLLDWLGTLSEAATRLHDQVAS